MCREVVVLGLGILNGDIVNLYRVVQHHLEEFVRQFRWALTSRQVFRWLEETRPETLTDMQRACTILLPAAELLGGLVDGRTFGTATTQPPGLNLLRIEESLSAAHLRLSGAYRRVRNSVWF